MDTVDLADVDHAHDIGMPKLRRELGLALESRNKLGVLAERGQHALQANTLLESAVPSAPCFESFRHSADAEAAQQMIRAKVSRLTGHCNTRLASSRNRWRGHGERCRLPRH